MSTSVLPAPAGRVSSSHRAHLQHVRARVVDLREQGVPYRAIATSLGITEREASQVYAGYVAEVAERGEGTEFIARHTRVAQLDWLLARLAVVVSQPVTNPAEMKRVGIKPVEWMMAVGNYQRTVGQAAALEGLTGGRRVPVAPAPDPGVAAAPEAAPDREAPDPELVTYALEYALGDHPDLYYEFRTRTMRRAFGDPEAQRVRVEASGPGPGAGDPGGDGGPGEGGPAPDPDADPG